MNVTLGGDRLGSGNKNKIALRNYERSTHNLSQKWTSSMTVGALYPFLVLPAMRGDKFEIDLSAAARTIPTQGPLFGSFKMQLDVFQCPVRLYQAILHNNPTNIGLQMAQVKFPQIKCYATAKKDQIYEGMEFSNSCLMKYLGISGLYRRTLAATETEDFKTSRNFNAIPLLAYYDIFKNYYSNKQEQNAYVIGATKLIGTAKITNAFFNTTPNINLDQQYNIINDSNILYFGAKLDKQVKFSTIKNLKIYFWAYADNTWTGVQESINDIYSQLDGVSGETLVQVNGKTIPYDNLDLNTMSDEWAFSFKTAGAPFYEFVKRDLIQAFDESNTMSISLSQQEFTGFVKNDISLQQFPLKNIDTMRLKLLSWNNVGTPFKIDGDHADDSDIWGYDSGETQTGLPYILNSDLIGTGEETRNAHNLNGLMIKTYQSDLFNNWIQTEWIDGENGIAAITAIDTSTGSFSIDTLNLSEKLYNMLNRIAVSGGTYEDWQDAVYMESPRRHMESPIYLGGMSSEVVFEEIIQSAPTEGSPLGTLGGRGVLVKRKGGKVNVKVDEASFIIGIVSLTPRLNYSQGNEWYMTDLETMDDLHKPALDGIGFQNLMAEQLAWFGTRKARTGDPVRETVGKVPAWINYMTAYDKVFGDLAEGENSFMVLNRNYEKLGNGGIADVTTYIDPTKYNYAFAYKALDAQNFWVQIYCDIKARRLMSAKQIPNI